MPFLQVKAFSPAPPASPPAPGMEAARPLGRLVRLIIAWLGAGSLLLLSVVLHSGIQISVQLWHGQGHGQTPPSEETGPAASNTATDANSNHGGTNDTAAGLGGTPGAAYNFSTVMLTLLSEVAKLAVVGAIHFVLKRQAEQRWRERQLQSSPSAAGGGPPKRIGWRMSLKFGVPALLYACSNNLTYVILGLGKSPLLYQVFGCVEVAMIAALSRVIVKRRINRVQWGAVVVLCTSVASCEIAKAGAEVALGFPLDVFLLTVLSCFFSSLAGVLAEYLLQHDRQQFGFFEQSMHLYLWGVAINFLVVLVHERHRLGHVLSLRGFGAWPAFIVVMYTVLGIVTGGILKYLDSIWRTIAQIISLFLTVLLSSLIFADATGMGFWLALFNVAVAIYLYHTSKTDGDQIIRAPSGGADKGGGLAGNEEKHSSMSLNGAPINRTTSDSQQADNEDSWLLQTGSI